MKGWRIREMVASARIIGILSGAKEGPCRLTPAPTGLQPGA